MLRQDPEAGGHKKLAANRFCVATQSNHVAGGHKAIMTVSNSIATELK